MRSRVSRRLRRFAKRVGSTLWLPAGWAHSGADILIRWVVRWWGSRQASRLLRGLPFLLVLVLAGYAAVASILWVDAWVGQEYSRAANAAVQQGDHRAAQLYLEWMARNGQGGLETTYRLALVSQELDEPDRCELLLNKLAPADRAVYAPAHLLRAKQILAEGEMDYPRFQRAQAQLLQAVSADPRNAEAQALLGSVYTHLRWWEEAETHLRFAVDQYPQYLLPLAKSLAIQGKVVQAQHYGERAQTYYRTLVEADPSDQATRLGWAESTMFLEQFESSVEILKEGLLLQDLPALRAAMTRLYITWSDTLGGDTEQTVEIRARQFELLAEGLKYNPREFLLFDRIMKVLQRDDEVTEQAHQFLVANLARGRVSMLCHLLLGTFEGQRGNTAQAIGHLQQAYELDSSAYIVANNLAWYLAHTDPPRLDEAFQLADLLANQWPKIAAIRDTRGQILAKQERWQEALVDLEAALPDMAGNRQLHETLALIYEHLNMPALSAEHKKLAEHSSGP